MLGSQGLRGKRWPYRDSTQVPFLIRWPGKVAAGSSLSMPFGTPDVFPTLCGLAGLDVPAGLDGRDFSGAIQGRSDAPTQEYAYTTMHHAFVPWPGWRGVRTERYNYARLESGSWVLFDLENDPYEEHNLVGENPGLVADMEGLLQEAMAANGDSWRGTPQECGDWEQWLGNKQIQQQGPDAVYPGSKVAQKGTGSGRDL
jgi:arylsulfatase A-like enzyme